MRLISGEPFPSKDDLADVVFWIDETTEPLKLLWPLDIFFNTIYRHTQFKYGLLI